MPRQTHQGSVPILGPVVNHKRCTILIALCIENDIFLRFCFKKRDGDGLHLRLWCTAHMHELNRE